MADTVDTADSASEAADSTPVAELDMDLKAESTKNSGSEATVASATKQTIQKDTGKAGTLEAQAFGTVEEHAASHDFPAHVVNCGPCRFWKNRWAWSAEFSYPNPVSQNSETWLGCKSGFAICFLCAAHKGAASSTQLGRGLGSFSKDT